jgi:hypothetical protein
VRCRGFSRGERYPHAALWAGAVTESSLRNMGIGGARNSYGNFPISRAGPGMGSWSWRRYRIASLILWVVIRLECFRNAWWSVDGAHQPDPLSRRSPTANPSVTRCQRTVGVVGPLQAGGTVLDTGSVAMTVMPFLPLLLGQNSRPSLLPSYSLAC